MKNIIKKAVAVCLSVLVMSQAASFVFADMEYKDVTLGSWYFDSVDFVSGKGFMRGVSADEFDPQGLITRGMFATIIYRIENEPEVTFSQKFSDVNASDYYAKSACWAAENSIIYGISDTSFAGNDYITREQMATIIYRYAVSKGIDAESVIKDTNILSYEDFFDISDYAKEAMHYMISAQIISGDEGGRLLPKNNATRAETAAVITRMLTAFGKDGKKDDIVILYTNDVHSGIEDNLGYASVAALKKDMQKQYEYVTLVDCGDAIQGDICGSWSKGDYIIDIMNEIGYDYAVLGNHEFDYGMEQLGALIKKSNAKYLNCNISYKGSGENIFEQTKPYEIKKYGDKKVAFIGVTTPYSVILSAPKNFRENNEVVYDFSDDTLDAFFSCIQKNVDECKSMGADYVVLLSHCGDTDFCRPYDTTNIVNHTDDIDVVLDAHSHSVIESRTEKSIDGDDVLISSTGTKLQNIGKLVFEEDGDIDVQLINEYPNKDEETSLFIESINEILSEKSGKVLFKNTTPLSISDEDGIRLVRSRETAIGDMCADALRIICDADIGLINGGGIRDSLPAKDITLGDIVKIFPYNDGVNVIKATGAQIADALEWSMKGAQAEYKKDGQQIGENGGFYSVSGMKFTLDVTKPSAVISDENAMFKGIEGEKRVSDIQIMNKDGVYEPLDVDKTYTVASTSYVLLNNGDGQTAFDQAEVAAGGGMLDNELLAQYLTEVLKGDLSQYSTVDTRINMITK